ncbi:MAG TPA: KUP/HAK/KT family potassium transporter [Flavobacteriales bacterium]|nr:KUP/HAK/KT family potassium transporter [Flavobacteriales bacterium]
MYNFRGTYLTKFVAAHGHHHKVTLGALIVTMGIIYGDIGTSPLYVMKAIVGEGKITSNIILGGISCIFWTLSLYSQTPTAP